MLNFRKSEIQSLKTKCRLSVLAVGVVLFLCVFSLIFSYPNEVGAEDEVASVSITSTTPTQITEGNYADYGFTADTYEDYLEYYAITSAEELYGFAALVNGGSVDIDGVLINDITVNENVLDDEGNLNSGSYDSWTPIGNISYTYTGTFDGQGYEISGLYFYNVSSSSNGSGYFIGLFGYVSGGAIENVGVVDSYIYGYRYVGGIVGFIKNATIEDCYNTGTVTAAYVQTGGVVGYSYGSTITNCYNTGVVECVSSSKNNYAGGVCGDAITNSTIINCYNTGTVTGSYYYVGGVVGYTLTGCTITSCSNTGTVMGSKYYVGGVVGYAGNGITVSSCSNTGTVTGSSNYVGGVVGYSDVSNASYTSTISDCYNTGSVTGSTYVGGVCGYNSGYSNAATISICYNTGSVTGSGNYVGGVVGYAYRLSTVLDCYNTGDVTGSTYVGGVCGRAYATSSYTGTISNCHNVGAVLGSEDVGGVCGNNSSYSTISNCYYHYENNSTLEAINTDEGTSTDVMSKTDAEFKSGDVCYLLNDSTSSGDLVWYQSVDNLNDHGGYPVFENNEDENGDDDTVYNSNLTLAYYTLSGTSLVEEKTTRAYSNYTTSNTATQPNISGSTSHVSSITVSVSDINSSYGTVYYGIALGDGDIEWYENGEFIDLYADTNYTVYAVYAGSGHYSHSETTTGTAATDPATYIITIPMTVAIEDDSTSAILTATDLDFGYDDTLTVSISTSDESDNSTVSRDNTGYYVLLTKSDDETTTVKSYIMSGTDYLSSLVLATYTYDGLDDYGTSETVSIAFAKPDASTLSTDAAALPAGTYSGTVVFTVEYTWGYESAS